MSCPKIFFVANSWSYRWYVLECHVLYFSFLIMCQTHHLKKTFGNKMKLSKFCLIQISNDLKLLKKCILLLKVYDWYLKDSFLILIPWEYWESFYLTICLRTSYWIELNHIKAYRGWTKLSNWSGSSPCIDWSRQAS